MFYNIGPQKSSREKKVEEQLLLQAQKKAHLWYTNFFDDSVFTDLLFPNLAN